MNSAVCYKSDVEFIIYFYLSINVCVCVCIAQICLRVYNFLCLIPSFNFIYYKRDIKQSFASTFFIFSEIMKRRLKFHFELSYL